MYYKTIIKGQFDFGKENTYEKVRKMADSKFEGLYRTEIAFDNEEVFFEDSLSFNIPRTVYNLTEKVWKNTLNLVEYLAQFAIVGRVSVWVLQEGQMVVKKDIEPNSEKMIVQNYLKANKFMEDGDDQKALESFGKVIDKYEKHSLAYEKRGLINYKLGNFQDAHYDFNKSIKLFTQNGTAYFGKALACIKLEKIEEALVDLDHTIKKTIPHQDIYWKARRMKGDILFDQSDFEGAHIEYSLISKRKFKETDPNYQWLKYCNYKSAESLVELKRFEEAVAALDGLLLIESNTQDYPEDEILVFKGEILKEAGNKAYAKEWRKAVKLGNKRASALLKAK